MSFPSRSDRILSRSRAARRFGALLATTALVTSFAGLAWTSPASALHGEGEPFVDNMKCADLAPPGVTWEELTIDGAPVEGDPYEHPDSDLVITISNASSQTFDWASNTIDMTAVIVKGSDGGFLYRYPGDEDYADTGLHALIQNEETQNYHGISHVSFCFQVGGDTQPVVTETPPVETPPVETPPVETPPAQTPPALQPAAAGTAEVMGLTLVQGDTLPRTGSPIGPLALTGGLGVALGLTMLLASRKASEQS